MNTTNSHITVHKQTIDVFKHTDYRTFLWAHHEDKKKRQTNWTLGRWAQMLGISSTSVLTNILNGKRNPGDKISGQFIKYFNFSEKEREYFLDLIELHKFTHKPRLTQLLIDKLGQSHPKGQFTLLNDQQFRIIARPYYYAIREIVNVKGFQENTDWIVKNLHIKVTKSQVETAIKDLLDLGLLKRDSQGRLLYTNEAVTTTHDMPNEALRRFHEEMLDLAKNSIREIPVLERDIASMTIAFDSQRLQECKEFLNDCRQKFMKKFETQTDADQVMHLEIALIPLSKKIMNSGGSK